MHRWPDRNLTRMELAMALLILALLIGAFSRHALIVFARAESALVSTSIVNMNTTLQYYAMIAALTNDVEKLAALVNTNTLYEIQNNIEQANMNEVMDNQFIPPRIHNWLPGNYIGELESTNPEDIEKGKWYFDKTEGMLVYRVNNSEFFHSELSGIPRIRFRFHVDYEDINLNGIYDPDQDKFRSIMLKSPDNYEWLIKQ